MRKSRESEALPPREEVFRSVAEAGPTRSSTAAPGLPATPASGPIHGLRAQNEEATPTSVGLEESRDRSLELRDLTPVGSFAFTREGLIVEANLMGAALLGVPRANLIRRELASFVASAEDRERWDRHRASVLQSADSRQGSGEPQRCELGLRRADGSTFHARLESTPLTPPERDAAHRAELGTTALRTALFDITELKRVEEALRTVSEQRRLALEGAGMGTWDYRPDTGEVFWDARCRDHWGVSQGEQFEYATAIAAIHPEDRAATEEAVKQAITGRDGGAYHQEFRVVWRDGSVHWIESLGQVHFEGEGVERRAVRFIGGNRDITEHKLLELGQAFLSHSGYRAPGEDFFQALARFLAQSLDMDYVCIDRLHGDGLLAQTVAVYSDGKFENNLIYALKDTPCGRVVGQTICVFAEGVRHLFPHDLALQELRAESYVGVTLWGFNGEPIGLIAVLGQKPLANPRLAESMLKLVSVRAAGEMERKRAEETLRSSEEEFRLVLEHSNDAIFWADADTGILLRCNRKAEELTERSRDELIGMHQRQLHPPDPRYTEIFRMVAARPAVENVEAEVLSRTGKRTPVLINTAVVVLGQRRIIQGIFRDVMELRQIQENLQRAHDELSVRVEQRTRDLAETVSRLEAEVASRIQIEAELCESEARYRTLFAAAPVGLAVTDRSGRVHDANAALCGMLGITLPEAQATNAGVFYAKPSDRRRFLSRFRRGNQAEEFETLLRRRDGTSFVAALRLNTIRTPKDQLFLTIVTDLTRRKQAERHIQGVAAVHNLFLTASASEEYLESVVRLLREWCGCACAGVRLLDGAGCLPFVASVGFTGAFLSAEKKLLLEAAPCPCLRGLMGELRPEETASAAVEGSVLCHDFGALAGRARAEDGALAAVPCAKAGYASVALAPIRLREQVIGAIQVADRQPRKFSPETAQFLDTVAPLVSEALNRFRLRAALRESETRFRSLFEHHQSVMLLVTPETGAIVAANQAAEAFYGYPRGRLANLSLQDLQVRRPRPDDPRRFRDSRELAGSSVVSHRLASGEIRTVEVHASPIAMEGRTLLFSIIHDITERRRLERDLLSIEDRERQRIGRDLHDSLGGALSGLAMVSKALARTIEPGSREIAEEIVQGINEAVRRTRVIASGLCPFGLGVGFINGLEELARAVEERHGIRCQLRASRGTVIEDDSVAAHLFQIVQEAVHNAVRHGEARQIEIAVHRQQAGLSVCVRDDGVGLPPDAARAPGMGLRTMRYRADVLGASFEIQSPAGGGTVVSCVLPAADLPSPDPPSAEATPAPSRT